MGVVSVVYSAAMKILVVAVGTRGDVQPMAVLSQALLARGHDVTLAASPDQGHAVEAMGVPFLACGRDVTAWVAGLNVSMTSLRASLRELRTHFETDIKAQLPVLVDAARGCDVVVGAALTPWVETLGELTGAQTAYVYYAPGLLRSRRHTPIGIPVQGLPGPINLLLHTLGLRFIDRVLVPLLTEPRAAFGLPPAAHFTGVVADDSLLCWDEALAETPDDLVPWLRSHGHDSRLHQVGSLQPAPGAIDDDTAAFVAAGPTVYVGFGSMPQRRFEALLTMVQQAALAAGVQAVLLGGPRRQVGPVLVLPQVDHGALFPRLLAVAHHGGAGTTAAAARAGVPQIVVPHFVDQPFWALCTQQRGLTAAVIHRQHLNAGRLARAFIRARDDVELQKRARAMQVTLAATDPVRAAVDVVEALGARGRRGHLSR